MSEHLSTAAAVRDGALPRDSTVIPDPPHRWTEYHQMQAFNVLWWSGGLADQPYLMMYELACIQEAVGNFQRQREAAEVAQANAEAAIRGHPSQLRDF